jgi:hypothetical protein
VFTLALTAVVPVAAAEDQPRGSLTGEIGEWCGPGATPGGNPIYAAATVPIRVAPDLNATQLGTWERRIQLRQLCVLTTRQPDGRPFDWRGVVDPSGFRGWVLNGIDRLTEWRPEPFPGESSRFPSRPQLYPVARDPRFGLNQAWDDGATADLAGAGWSRLVFWWSAFQYGNREEWHSTAVPDPWLEDELARGRELVGVVLSTPEWASTNGKASGVPKNLYLPWNHKDNFWGQFMKRLAAQYAGRVNTWIIGNEVDIASGQWHTWDGTVQDYVQLLKVAYQAIKAGNPHARVAHYGSPWWYDHGEYLGRFLDLIAADPAAPANNYFFDIGNFHLYSRAADIPKVVPWYREALSKRGIPQKPIWVGETNVVPHDDPIWGGYAGGFMASMDEQANYVVESLATYMALGVERVGFNRLMDGQDFRNGGEPFGLLRNDGSKRPAFRAFQVATQLFSRAGVVSFDDGADSGYAEVVLERPGERITVAWSMRGTPIRYRPRALGDQSLLVGKYGESRPLVSDAGRYDLVLLAATANTNDADPTDFVVGGDPIIIVERYDGQLATGLVL